MELCAQSCNRLGLIFLSKAGLILPRAAGFGSEMMHARSVNRREALLAATVKGCWNAATPVSYGLR